MKQYQISFKDGDSLALRVDQALYDAKNTGKDRCVYIGE